MRNPSEPDQVEPPRPSDEQWVCGTCGYTYDPAAGFYDRESGVQYEPHTPWESLPDEIVCPDCGSAKTNFTKVPPPPPAAAPD